jgi:hypothetical protein
VTPAILKNKLLPGKLGWLPPLTARVMYVRPVTVVNKETSVKLSVAEEMMNRYLNGPWFTSHPWSYINRHR